MDESGLGRVDMGMFFALIAPICGLIQVNHQKILPVGEGNFSFATSLANAFGSASSITAPSLDSRDTVVKVYPDRAETSLCDLKDRGAIVIHGVDAHIMNKRATWRIVFNFPHAGGDYYNVGVTESATWYIE